MLTKIIIVRLVRIPFNPFPAPPDRGIPHADGPDVGTVRGLCRLLARSPGSDRWLPGLVSVPCVAPIKCEMVGSL